jgi:hypothetical protein
MILPLAPFTQSFASPSIFPSRSILIEDSNPVNESYLAQSFSAGQYWAGKEMHIPRFRRRQIADRVPQLPPCGRSEDVRRVAKRPMAPSLGSYARSPRRLRHPSNSQMMPSPSPRTIEVRNIAVLRCNMTLNTVQPC